MKNQISNSVAAQGAARQFSFTRFASLVGVLSASLCLPGLAAAQSRTHDPVEPPAHQPSLPALRVADNQMAEGDDGASVLRFRVSIEPASTVPVTLSYRVLDRSARCLEKDYQIMSGTVTIPANVTSSEIPVTVFGDQLPESNETFVIYLTSASDASIADATATGTIVNDDRGGGGGPRRIPEMEGDPRRTEDPVDPPSPPSVSVSVADNTMSEGHAGTAAFCFRLNLSQPSATPVTLTYRVIDRSARCDNSDYQAAAGTVTIPAHVASSEIGVTVYGDRSREDDENFEVVLSDAENAQIADGFATGTITNDDFQGGGGGPRHLPEGNEPAPAQAKAKKVTWGQLKSIYR